MKKTLTFGALLMISAFASAQAQTTAVGSGTAPGTNNSGWSGTGELGYAAASGNTHSENGNAKLNISHQSDVWTETGYMTALRTRSDSDGKLYTSAERYELGASVGYKLDVRSYIVNSLRYEHDDFGSDLWQAVYSLGYGFVAIKDGNNELSFEVGPGYKRYRETANTDSDTGRVTSAFPTKGEAIGRGLVDYKRRLGSNVSAEETFLVEAGSDNRYYKNDLGFAVSMTKKFSLKLAYELRYNSDVTEDTHHMDRLFTTNLAYNF